MPWRPGPRSMLARKPLVAITSQMWRMSSALAVHTPIWCRRGPRPLVKARSCTLPLRCIHTAHSFGIGIVGLGVFGQAEAELGVEVVGRLHVGREAVDVVDALDARALVGGVSAQHALGLVHA